MKALIPVSNRLVEIEREIQQSDGLITPEQEMEIEAIITGDLTQAGRTVVTIEQQQAKLDALIKQAKGLSDYYEQRAGMYRAAMARLMSEHANGDGKYSIKDTFFGASLSKGKGRVEVFDPENVPRIYMKKVETWKPDTELLRAGLEVEEPGATACARLVVEPHVVIRVNKDALLQAEIKGALE